MDYIEDNFTDALIDAVCGLVHFNRRSRGS